MKKAISQIVLLGGGYVSIWAYRSLVKGLRRELDGGLIQISVVCPEEHHFFHGWTAESLTCIIQDQNRMSPLSEVLSKAKLIIGNAEEIETYSNTVYVRMKDGARQALSYDHLLIGIGSYDSEGVEGVNEYGYQVKSHRAFQRTKEDIQSIVKQAAAVDGTTALELLSFVIAGGGFAGIELAANIAEFVNVLKKGYPTLRNIKPSIRLINSREEILNTLGNGLKSLRHYVETIMYEYGIEIVNNMKISKVIDHGAFLSDGRFLNCSMVISTIGQSRIFLKGTENMKRDIMGRIYTNKYLNLKNHSNIWGGGDACNVTHYQTMEPCPSSALWAIKHGEYAGRNIARSVQARSLKPFKFRGLGQCASLGIGKGFGELYGITFTGWLAWIMRWCFFNYFMPSRRVMIRAISDWMYLLFFGKRKVLAMQERSLGITTKIIPNRVGKQGPILN